MIDSITSYSVNFGKFPCLPVPQSSLQTLRLCEDEGPFRPGNVSVILPGTAEAAVQEASKSDSARLNPGLPTIWFGSHYKVSGFLLRKYQVKSNLPHDHTGSLMTGLRRKNPD